MADRLNQYPMLPTAFNPSILQQQQLSQQSQQQPQGESHPLQGISNPERARMWQAMQQQQQLQHQNQFRGQNGNEMPGGGVNQQQMADLLRSQNLARVQAQQGQQQMGQQQQFGLPPQMNPGGQHPGFHEQQNTPQSQMPSNFNNMGVPSSAQLQANFNTRNAMLQAFNQGPMSRQLELMGLAQNQQHQNPQAGPPNFGNRIGQPPQQGGLNGQNQQPQQGLFSSPSMQPSEAHRGSPPHPTSQTPGSMPTPQGGMQQNGQGMPAGRRPMTFNELRDRATAIQEFIRKQETAAMNLNNQRSSIEPANFMAQMQTLAAEVREKKALLQKVVQAMNQMHPQGASNGSGPQGASPGNVSGMGTSPVPQHPQAGPSGQTQAPWMQPGLSPAQTFQIRNGGGPQLPARGPSQPQNIQSSPLIHPAGAQPNLGPQRPGSTSHQVLSGQLPNQTTPNQFSGGQFGSSAMPNGQNANQMVPPPLDKAKFEESYAAFCSTRPIVRDERAMQIDNRPIDLHSLHANVLTEGGAEKVTQREMWPIIGARMGFVQFPGTSSEPATSGPGVAQQLQNIHSEYLAQFDSIYVHSVLQKRALHSQGSNGAGPSQVGNAANSNGPTNNSIAGANQVSLMNAAVMQYANVSAADMRARNVPESLINFVEHNRAHLQRTQQQQQAFRGVVQKPNQLGQGTEPDRLNGIGQFPNIPAQQPQQHIPGVTGNRIPQPQGLPATGMGLSGAANNGPSSQQQNLSTNSTLGIQRQQPARPTPEQSRQASEFVQRAKQEFVTKSLPVIKQHTIPEQQRAKYVEILEQVQRMSGDIEPKLPMYYYILRDGDTIKRLIAIICTTREQLRLIQSGIQRYILPLSTLPNLIAQVQQINIQFQAAVSSFMTVNQQVPNNAPPNGLNTSQQRPPVPQPGPPQQLSQPTRNMQQTPSLPPQPNPQPSTNRQANLSQPPPPKKRAQQLANQVASTPTPPASTPVASAVTPAVTPAAASPKTPKSPKGKATPKPKPPPPPKRKPSKVVPPTPEPAPATAPSPAGSLKRQREEEELTNIDPPVSSAPSPKKVKTEWDGPPSDALVKKEQQIENIKSEEDASAFLEQMTELIRLAGEGQDSLNSDISETLDTILRGVAQDTSDTSGTSSMAPLGLADMPQPTNALPAADEFQDFLDFTSCAAADEDGSKPATPDLISSSSTNPSPESASDPADAAAHAAASTSDNARLANFKIEDSYDAGPLGLGAWKEIDGGESSYYQSDKWNWEGPMPVLDQPWAFTS